MAIFIIDSKLDLYVSSQEYLHFHHSSLTQGEAILAAGELKTDPLGKILEITNSSGHYHPLPKDMIACLDYFHKKGVNLKEVKLKITYEDAGHLYLANYNSAEGFLLGGLKSLPDNRTLLK